MLGLGADSRLLDVCCGMGRHAIPLAKLGVRVTGVDISTPYLKHARAEAKRQGVEVRFVKIDMRKIDFRSEFDGAINLFTSFGYFPRARDDLKVLRNIARALKPGGVFLLDIINGTRITRNFKLAVPSGMPINRWARLGDGTYQLEESVLLKRVGAVRTHWTFLTNGTHGEMVSFTRMYSKESLSELLRKAGLRVVRVCGDLQGAAYNPVKSTRLVILSRKPA
jgi:SAM-dependent methyltransferase